MTERQVARLIPVGKSSTSEAEQRATSALLAVLSIVRPFSRLLLTPLGASNAIRATVGAFIEVSFKHPSGQMVRPDGLIEIRHGKRDPFTALVEVKTGTSKLEVQQIQNYLDVAREQGYDCVLTISNEIAPAPGVHPTPGLKVRSTSKVKLHHLSWMRILSEGVKVKVHRGIEDPEQAWILGELIRYLEHPLSGAMCLEDMGVAWTEVRNGAREATLHRKDENVWAIAQIWNQILQFVALQLGAEIGSDVQELIPRKQQQDAGLRTREFVESLCKGGILVGALRIPKTIGDLELVADLRAKQSTLSVTFDAPTDRGAKARVSWLTRQLRDSPGSATVEAFAKNSRSPLAASLESVRENASLLIGNEKRDPAKFRVIIRRDLGINRRNGKGNGFIESVSFAVESFYAEVLQTLQAWQSAAPRIRHVDPPVPADPPLSPSLSASSSDDEPSP